MERHAGRAGYCHRSSRHVDRQCAGCRRARQFPARGLRLVPDGGGHAGALSRATGSAGWSDRHGPGTPAGRAHRAGPLSCAVRIRCAIGRHHAGGGTLPRRGAQYPHCAGQRGAAAHLFSCRDRRPRGGIPRFGGGLSRSVRETDRRLSVRGLQRGVQSHAHRLRHADHDLSGYRRAPPAIHPRHLAGARGAAQLVGQRRVSGFRTRQLVRGPDHLHGRLRLQGARGRSSGAGCAPRLAARLRGHAARRRPAAGGLYLAHPRRIADRRLSQVGHAVRHAA